MARHRPVPDLAATAGRGQGRAAAPRSWGRDALPQRGCCPQNPRLLLQREAQGVPTAWPLPPPHSDGTARSGPHGALCAHGSVGGRHVWEDTNRPPDCWREPAGQRPAPMTQATSSHLAHGLGLPQPGPAPERHSLVTHPVAVGVLGVRPCPTPQGTAGTQTGLPAFGKKVHRVRRETDRQKMREQDQSRERPMPRREQNEGQGQVKGQRRRCGP